MKAPVVIVPVRLEKDPDVDGVRIIDHNGNPLIEIAFHRMMGEISNVVIKIHPAAVVEKGVPSIIYHSAVQKPALIKE